MDIVLTLLSCLAGLVFVGALAFFVLRIIAVLESIGTGGKSSLAMIAWGVRAIEVETAHIPTEVTALNGRLSHVAAGLEKIDEGLVAIASAASQQPRYRS